MKKIISVLLAVVMVMCASVSALAATPAEEAKLQFNEDGTFKILNISDIQDQADLLTITADFMKAAIEAEQPDLIILTGDNISGNSIAESKTEKAIRSVMDVLDPYGIPVAIVFGNHDEESGMSKEAQMAIYNSYSSSISYDEGEALWGCGTYNIPIYSSTDDSDIVFNCWLFDSGSNDETGAYDHVKQDQLDWYKAKSAELKAANGGENVPSIAFQHIIVPEIFEALDEVDASTEGAIAKNGKYYVLPATAKEGSIMGEAPCPSGTNGGEYDAFLECGDVLAVVSGHDHTNSFVIPYKGIDIINTPTCGFRSYGLSESRGIRVFELNEAAPAEYTTRIVSFEDYFADDFARSFTAAFYGVFGDLMTFFYGLWSKITSMFGVSI